ncbi:MAG: MFS transporter [Alphaproteobacteria bacterium]|nr:MFS transporter [Alphaproteobacteria bacterium]
MASAAAKRNVLILLIAQALANTTVSIMITTAPLVGAMLAEDKSLATLPHAFQWLAVMAVATPASFLMRNIGRRQGFMLGGLFGITGALTGAAAIWMHAFWLYVAATVQMGVFSSFAMFYRFAAAEAAEDPQFRVRAISYVIGGGILAAIIGPELAKSTREMLPLYVFAGTYLVLAVVPLLGILVVSRVNLPPLTAAERADPGRPLAEIARQPSFIVAVLGGMIAWSAMVFLMTSTPLSMQACGFDFDTTASVIQWHIVAMYAPSFVTGWMINRFGLLNVMSLGVVLALAAVAAGLGGLAEINFLLTNICIGAGWSLLFVGATDLLTRTYRPSERAKVQGFNDMMIFGTVAASTLASGYLTQTVGWNTVLYADIPMILIAFAAVVWLRLRRDPAVVRA